MNHTLPLINDFRSLVLQKQPLIDVRAPIEFAKGAFPNSINLPLMSDEERHLVGKRYKEAGNEKAVELGHQLVGGKTKTQRVQAWLTHIQQEPQSYLYCFRGGQRSQISQQWIADAGITVPRLEGGYKAFRAYLIEQLDTLTQNKQMKIIGGHTGAGKTLLLKKIQASIDLEGIAHHRGSSFGRFASPQPTQIDFENSLAYALITHDEAQHRHLILEDESRNIGQCYLPHAFFAQMGTSPVILLDTSIEARIEITYDEYIIQSQTEYATALQAGTIAHPWIDTMQHNFKRIQKRLGNEGHTRLTTLLDEAWKHQQSTNDPTQHKVWIKELLEKYYDPMYTYQIEQKRERVIFSGNETEILDYLKKSY